MQALHMAEWLTLNNMLRTAFVGSKATQLRNVAELLNTLLFCSVVLLLYTILLSWQNLQTTELHCLCSGLQTAVQQDIPQLDSRCFISYTLHSQMRECIVLMVMLSWFFTS